MKKIKKNVGNAIFLLLTFSLTVYGVMKGENISEILADIKQVRQEYILYGILCVILFIWGESLVIHYLMNTFSLPIKRWKCFLFSSVGFFFSCITPSASGGQPMQIYYMKKEKLPVPVSSLVLLIVTITYKMVLVLIGAGLILFGQGFMNHYLSEILPVFYLGLSLNVICVTFMLLLVFHPVFAKTLMTKGLHFLERLHLIKNTKVREKKLEDSMDLYHAAAGYLRNHKRVIFNVFVVTFLQRIALFFVTYFVYRSLSLSGQSMLNILLLQAVIAISVDMLPLPGGMGISETLFLTIFVPIFGEDLLVTGLILSRGIGYYAQLLVSAVMTVAAQFTLGKVRGKA